MPSRRLLACLLLLITALATVAAQSKKTPPRKTPPPKAPTPTVVEPAVKCPSELGVGLRSKRRFCDVLTGNDPATGILIAIPPHRGPLLLSFDLHNRHTYSEELIKAKTAFRDYTASIGVFFMDNTLIERALIASQFRTAADLFDRVGGGAGPGGLKAVAPTGAERVLMPLPEDVEDQVSILGEKLKVLGADGKADTFLAPGRPIAMISNVTLEYQPAPPPKKTTKRPRGSSR